MKMNKSQQAAFERCLQEFDKTSSAYRDEREQSLKDRRFLFIAGAQYEGGLREEYQNKASIEINRVEPGVKRIINEYRNNRVEASFIPADGGAVRFV